MELIKQVIPILLTGSLGLLVVSIGLASKRGDLRYVLQRPKLLGRALLAVDVVPLIAAIVAVAIFPTSTASKAALVLMAISPVPPLVPGKMLKFGGRNEYAFSLYAVIALLAVVTTPLLGALMSRYYGIEAQFPMSIVARNVFVGVVIPLGIGLALGHWLGPQFSQRAAPIVQKFAMLLLVLACVPIVVSFWPSMVQLIGDGTVLAILFVVAISVAGGHLLGGSTLGDKSTLAVAAGIRHPGIALALAGANHLDPRVSAGVLLFVLIGFLALVPYQAMLKRWAAAAPT